jgi:DinB superfamily
MREIEACRRGGLAMEFRIDQAVEVLRSTPSVLRSMLGEVSDLWVRSNYGIDTFSPFDVVGHLIHGERADWIGRTKMILEHGESQAFEPFDRYAMYEASAGKSIKDLLGEFAALRSANLVTLEDLALTDQQLALRGVHPALGTVRLDNLLATWVVHDLNHIAQIAKAMAYQYGESVGPWREYLSILPD